MLTITLVAVVLGAFRITPGLGILLVIIVSPAWIRTCLNVIRREARGRPMNAMEKLGLFAGSLGVVTIALVAVLLGVALMSPGLGIVLAVALAPAFLRTCLVTARQRARGEPVSLTDKLGSFGASFAVTLGLAILTASIVVVAVVAALFVICWAAIATGL